MYANAPHASVTPPVTTTAHQALQGQVPHGQQPGVPSALPGGHYGAPTQIPAAAPLAAPGPQRSIGAAYVTGAYQASGDPAIDRMLRLEAACKRFGSPI